MNGSMENTLTPAQQADKIMRKVIEILKAGASSDEMVNPIKVGGKVTEIKKSFEEPTLCTIDVRLTLHVSTEGTHLDMKVGDEAIQEIDDLIAAITNRSYTN